MGRKVKGMFQKSSPLYKMAGNLTGVASPLNKTIAGAHIVAIIIRPRQVKNALEHEQMRRFRLSCACAKYYPSLCSPFIHSVVSNDSVSRQ